MINSGSLYERKLEFAQSPTASTKHGNIILLPTFKCETTKYICFSGLVLNIREVFYGSRSSSWRVSWTAEGDDDRQRWFACCYSRYMERLVTSAAFPAEIISVE